MDFAGVDADVVSEPLADPPAEGRPAVPPVPFRPARQYYRSGEDDPAAAAASRYPARTVVPTILLAAVLAHGLCLRSTFYLEDWKLIVANEWVEYGAWWQADLRALTYFTYWLTHALCGFSSPAFHLVNLGLHLGVSLLVAGLGRDLLAEAAGLSDERARRIGWWAGLLFAVHPLGSEVLNYARMRDIELVTLCTLLAMRAAVRWRRQRSPGFGWPAATLCAVAAATFCKEVGFLLAAGGALLVWLRTPPPPEFETRRAVAMPLPAVGPTTAVKTKLVATPKDASILKGNWPVALSLGLVAMCIAAVAWPLWTTAAAALHHPRLGWHTLSKTRVFWMYLQRAVVPVGLCSDHQIAWTVGTGDPVAWIAAGTELLAIAGAVFLYFRREAGSRTVGILLGLMLLDIVHRLANPNAELMVESRMYPALGPLCILLAWGLDWLVRWRRDGKVSHRPLLAAYLLGALVLTGIVLSARRALTWRDTPTLVADVVRQYPNQARAWQELQDADVRGGYWTATMQDQQAVRSALAGAEAFNVVSRDRKYLPTPLLLTLISSEGNYALALAKLGRGREAAEHLAWVQKSVPGYGEAALPCKSEFFYVRGLTKEAVHQTEGAVEDLKESQRLTGNLNASRELRRIWMEQQKRLAKEEPVVW